MSVGGVASWCFECLCTTISVRVSAPPPNLPRHSTPRFFLSAEPRVPRPVFVRLPELRLRGTFMQPAARALCSQSKTQRQGFTAKCLFHLRGVSPSRNGVACNAKSRRRAGRDKQVCVLVGVIVSGHANCFSTLPCRRPCFTATAQHCGPSRRAGACFKLHAKNTLCVHAGRLGLPTWRMPLGMPVPPLAPSGL